MSLKKNILFKSIPAADWTSLNPLLKEGEPGIESDTGKMKVGDGSTRWSDLDYQAADKANAEDLSDKADKSNVLELNNTTPFTPDADYEPATKKYVDDNAGGAPEGTAVKSTGETGGSKFLREDGDGTCSWQTPASGGLTQSQVRRMIRR
jgi:hypothetical protein